MAHIDCICPPKADGEPRHPDGDDVEFRERLDFRAGRSARYMLLDGRQHGRSDLDIAGEMAEWYLLVGITTWTVTDEHGKPVEPSPDNVRRYLLDNDNQRPADDLADVADTLYSEAVIAPLVSRAPASTSSPPTPITESTSATSQRTSTPRTRRSKPSSTTTSRTAGTVRIVSPRDGDSSSSLSLAQGA